MPHHEPVIQTLGPRRPHPTLRYGVRSRSFHGRACLLDAKRLHTAVERSTVTAVPIMDQKARWLAIDLADFRHLLRGYPGVDDLPRSMLNHEEHIERAEPDGLNREQIASPDFIGMLRQELSPPRRRLAIPSLSHVFCDGSRADVEPQVGELALDAPLAPQGILPRHATDQLSELGRYVPPPSSLASPRSPTPVGG